MIIKWEELKDKGNKSFPFRGLMHTKNEEICANRAVSDRADLLSRA